MRNIATLRWMGLGLTATLALAGCGSDGHDGESDGHTHGTEDVVAPVFQEGQGQAAAATPEYPAAPYGFDIGSIIENYEFIGYANSVADSSALQVIKMSDFYNPTGDGVYEEGSPFGAGNPKPKALLIDSGSTWCPPCNEEAKSVLPGEYAKYKPLGGQFLFHLGDGPTPGKAAKTKDLNNWTSKYDVDYPAIIDPNYKLLALWNEGAWPTNMIIKTATMEIIEIKAGVPQGSFWAKFQKVLDGQL